MKNDEIARMFDRMADLLEFQGETAFKINAYRKASRNIKELGAELENLWKADQLESIPGIGKGLAKKITEFLETGHMTKYEEIVNATPPSLIELIKIQNLGPKTLALAHKTLHVNNLDDLKKVIGNGSLSNLSGMGIKKIENLQKGIEFYEKGLQRLPLGIALPLANEIVHQMRKHSKIQRIFPTGSIRRMKETVGDIDILAESDEGEKVIQHFVSLSSVTRILAQGKTKGSVIVENRYQVDLRVVATKSFGAALQYFTGSKEHNVRLREIAKRQGLKINEYGIFRDEEQIGGSLEEDIYEMLGLPLIPPEIRENRGEIEAALEDNLPSLLDIQDIGGDFHVHSQWSDGSATIEQMAEKAELIGYEFLAICDHSLSAGYAGGLTSDQIKQQIDKIKLINNKMSNIRILAGSEVDIRKDGSLDFPDEILSQLDIVVASIHSGFKHNITKRFIAAAKNPYVKILGHPTGRLISQREGYEVDLEAVMRACKETGTSLEINSWFERLDLNDIHARQAKKMGIKLAINTDAHHPDDMDSIILGVGVARRAWLEREDILNSLSVEEILNLKKQ